LCSGEAELAKYKELRARYLEALQAKAKPTAEALAKKLLEQEKVFLEARQYTDAARIRTERESLAAELGYQRAATQLAASGGSAELHPDGSVLCPVASALLLGGVVLDGEALVGWKDANAKIRWQLPTGLPAGGYEVEAICSIPSGGGGRCGLKADFHTLSTALPSAKAADTLQTLLLGTLRITDGAQFLELSAEQVLGGSLWKLHSLRLLSPNRPEEP
jgi:hypothetical protein